MNEKPTAKWWLVAIALFFLVGANAWLTAKYVAANKQIAETEKTIQTAFGERDNAKEMARQWEEQYRTALLEISELKAENEELNRRFEEVSFALDEVCYETGWNSLGIFQVTHYCACERCCGKYASGYTATGTKATEGQTIAVDPNVIPLGSEVKINGHIYVAEDTGVKGHVIDIFVNDHNYALQLGTYKAEVEYKNK